MKTKISLLASGNLGFNMLTDLFEFTEISFLATDKNSKEIIEFAQLNNIPLFIGNPRNGKLSSFIYETVGKTRSEILLSINYLFLINKDVFESFLYPINFHGGLLPKYRGRTPHVWAIINNEKETGVTAHVIDSGCDTGEIILQKKIPILENDTGFSILEKFNKIYPIIIRDVIRLCELRSIQKVKQDDLLSTTYSKRTPNDGKINWDWQKERIRNWVRAQAYPYPGAFTFFHQKKIIIDKVSFSDVGFKDEVPNGTILQVEPSLIIKTPNGSVKLEIVRSNQIDFVQNEKLQ